MAGAVLDVAARAAAALHGFVAGRDSVTSRQVVTHLEAAHSIGVTDYWAARKLAELGWARQRDRNRVCFIRSQEATR